MDTGTSVGDGWGKWGLKMGRTGQMDPRTLHSTPDWSLVTDEILFLATSASILATCATCVGRSVNSRHRQTIKIVIPLYYRPLFIVEGTWREKTLSR